MVASSGQPFGVVALTDAATIAVNAAAGSVFRVTLGASGHTLGNPSNANLDGQGIRFEVTQGGAGSNLLSYGGNYEFTTGLPAPMLSTAAGAIDLLGFVWNATKGKWIFVAFIAGA